MEPFDTKTIRFDGLNLSQQQLFFSLSQNPATPLSLSSKKMTKKKGK
jgi:hypothetical protein